LTGLKFRKKYHLSQDKYICYHQYFYNKSINTSIISIIFSLFIIITETMKRRLGKFKLP